MEWVFRHGMVVMLMVVVAGISGAQTFYFGADLSYVNEMEDCGAVYQIGQEPQDPYMIFKDWGCNLVRLRLWHTPSWYDGLNQGYRYSDYEDVRRSILRARVEGMEVLLAFHLSDNWADPGHQVAPAAWWNVLDDLPLLQDSLYRYMYGTLQKLAEEQLLPDIVQIGNETNKGILLSQEVNDEGWSLSWPRNSVLFNAAIGAVRDIESDFSEEVDIALHIANPEDVGWYIEQFWDHGVRDFDIIGISYYRQFHDVGIDIVGSSISDLKNTYPGKEVMILETAYPWTVVNADGANNILFNSYPGYSPHSPAHQKQWMIDLTQEVMDHGGRGVVYWEPAWVSTDCRTQWAQGSHWDNAVFFNAGHELIESGGIGWMAHVYNPVSVNGEAGVLGKKFSVYHDGYGLWLFRDGGNSYSGVIRVQLYTMDGRRIMERVVVSGSEGDVYFIRMPEVVSGIYLVVVDHGEGVEVVRVVNWE